MCNISLNKNSGQKYAMVDDTIPAYAMAHLKKIGYEVFIWGGTSLDVPYKKVHTLSRQSGIGGEKVKFGKLETILNRYKIEVFMSRDEYGSFKQFNQWVTTEEDDMHFAEGDGRIYRRWVQADSESCPICVTLDEMGYFADDEARAYSWEGGFKFVQLPDRGHAHSEIGEGHWNAPDSSCKCTIRATFSKKDLTGLK